MSRIVIFLCLLFAATLFVACATVHVLSLIPGTVLPSEVAIPLHLGAMAAVFLVIIHGGIVRRRGAALGMEMDDVTDVLGGRTPRVAAGIGTVLFFYVIFNFLYFAITNEGTARIRDNNYVLMRKSTFLRDLTEAEYHEYKRRELRGMSGHWVLFSLLATGYFLFVVPRVRRELDRFTPPDDTHTPRGGP